MPTRKSKPLAEMSITNSQAAELLGMDPKFVQRRIQEGFILPTARGRMTLGGFVSGLSAYLDHVRKEGSKSAASSRASEARTREIELRIAERQRELMPIDEVREVVSEHTALFISLLQRLPAQCTRDLELRRRIETAVGQAQDELRDHATRKLRELVGHEGARDEEPGDLAGGVGGGE